ncbi:hypothetical protein INT48_006814, partial [Thamnidium elegans]
MAKKGNKKKNNARNNKKKVANTDSTTDLTQIVNDTIDNNNASEPKQVDSLAPPKEHKAGSDEDEGFVVSTITVEEEEKESHFANLSEFALEQLEIAQAKSIATPAVTQESPQVQIMSEPAVTASESTPVSNDTTEPIVAEKEVEDQQPKVVVEQAQEPVNESKSVDEVKPVEETKPVEVKSAVEEVKPLEEVKPVEEVKIVQESKPTKETKSVEEAKVIEAVNPVEEVKLAEGEKTVEEIKPVEEIKLAEEINPAEKVKSDEESKPIEKVQVAETKDNETNQKDETVAPVSPPKDIVTLEEPSIVVTEVTHKTSNETPSIQEDTPTIRSQSIALSATTEQSTIGEEPEVAKPAAVQELLKENKNGFIKKNRSAMGDIGNQTKEKGVTKRKSQILSLFKRGGEKEKTIGSSPLSELSTITEKKNQKQSSEKKLKHRKSWMFWKSSSPTTVQQ